MKPTTPESAYPHIQRTIRRWKIFAVLAVAFSVAMVFCFVVLLLTKPDVPPKLAQNQMPDGRHRVDVLLIDQPELTSDEIEAMVRPLIMVADLRMPGEQQHFRLLLTAGGFAWGYAESAVAAAGYVAEEDLFLVDVKAVRESPVGFNLDQRWGFVMGHEATHLWQNRRGSLMGKVSNMHNRAAYRIDPIEIEASTEGITVANALRGDSFIWRHENGEVIAPLSPNYYSSFANRQVAQRAEVHIRSQTTPLGQLRLFLQAHRGAFWFYGHCC